MLSAHAISVAFKAGGVQWKQHTNIKNYKLGLKSKSCKHNKSEENNSVCVCEVRQKPHISIAFKPHSKHKSVKEPHKWKQICTYLQYR